MTNYLITQAINITVLIVFTLLLVLRSRTEFKRHTRALEEVSLPKGQTQEERKVLLRTQIETLQHELNELDGATSASSASALRPFDSATG